LDVRAVSSMAFIIYLWERKCDDEAIGRFLCGWRLGGLRRTRSESFTNDDKACMDL